MKWPKKEKSSPKNDGVNDETREKIIKLIQESSSISTNEISENKRRYS
jgi:hypothetical protein